jgi:fatty-acyl-CoA synthase
MGVAYPLDRTVRGGFPALHNEADLRALEQVPYAERITARSTYEALCNAAAVDPAKPALHFLPQADPDETPLTLSHGDFLARVRQVANLLHDLGVGPTDVVSFLLPLLPQAYCVLFGGEAAGIVNPVNPLLEPQQIASILRAAGTKVLVAPAPQMSAEIWAKALAVREELPHLRAIVQVGAPPDAPDERDGVVPYERIARYPGDRLLSGREIAPEELAAYFHTGGTTGLPKLVRHTHANQVFQAWVGGAVFGNDSQTTILGGLPLFHVGGAFNHGLQVLAWGGTVVILSAAGFRNPASVRNYWRLVERYRANAVSAVPTVLAGLLHVPCEGVDLSSLRFLTGGGSAIPVEVGRALQEKTGRRVVEVYGMTETSSVHTSALPEGDSPLGNVGLAVPYARVKAVQLDAEGRYVRDCAPDEIGVVAMQGLGVFAGYVQDVHNADAFVQDGWLNSGDLGRVDAKGYLWITGRAKDTIIRGGHNIDPVVIEEALYQHPAVGLAAAVGKPDGYAGELPVAYVQLKPGLAARDSELAAFVREHISERAAAPTDVFFIDPMPLTGVGKVFKPALRWDAARRVFEAELGALPELKEARAGLVVEVGPHEVHGSLATVTLSGVPARARPALERAVDERLAPFTLRHQLQWKQ